jgi:hypothetical protein
MAARRPENEIQYYITSDNMIENILVVLIKVEQQQTTPVAIANEYNPTTEHVH